MASHISEEDLKQRKTKEPNTKNTTTIQTKKNKNIPKRGLKSLSLAITLPISLTLLTIFLTSPPHSYNNPPTKPFWFPSITSINIMTLASSFLMGLSAWLVWAKGGFHAKPAAVFSYLSYVVLCLGWYGLGCRMGMVACLGSVGALVGCWYLFKGVSSVAADLVKPCLVWAVFFAVVNITLVSL